jgi:phosphatidylserine decarboxylase
MKIIFLVLLLVVLWLSQKFSRHWFFERKGKVPIKPQKEILSPVDGIVCYVKTHSDFRSKKRWDEIQLEKKDDKYMQIGIYMSGYDRHTVYCPVCGILSKIYPVGVMSKNVSMIDFWSFIKYYYLGKKPTLAETPDNYTLIYEFITEEFGPVVMAVISDKFVGLIENYAHSGTIDQTVLSSIIKRGSQVDLFLLEENIDRLCVKVGDQVKIGEVLFNV